MPGGFRPPHRPPAPHTAEPASADCLCAAIPTIPNSPKRAELELSKLEDHVNRIVADWPELTGEQLDRIAALLRTGEGAA